jgi:hypothetical protein
MVGTGMKATKVNFEILPQYFFEIMPKKKKKNQYGSFS